MKKSYIKPEGSAVPSREEERGELNAVAEALAKSPRLSRLVRYLAEKYFQGELDQLNEFNIATEVFDRSKKTFDPGVDAIARVEAHRLRKWLREFYRTTGKEHSVQLSIPSGTYVPVFVYQPDESPEPLPEEPPGKQEWRRTSSAVGESAPSQDRLGGRRSEVPAWRTAWGRLYPWLPAALILVAFVVYWAAHSGSAKGSGKVASPSQPPASVQPASPNLAQLPLRIIAGYSGKPQIDSAGAVWGPDQYFHSGGTWTRSASFIARTSDPMLFEQWRTGDFFYDIPLPPGVYELHLYFVTVDNDSDASSTFTVAVNGVRVLQGFDVNSDALGENVADERIFRDISPAQDGYLHLGFTSERGAPALNALEILPGIPHKQLPIRLVTQPTSFTDHDGNIWQPDDYFMNGRTSTQRQKITGSLDPDLFAAERYGHFTYGIPVDTRGRYTLVLHFAEFYHGLDASGPSGTGTRRFRVMCNGVSLLEDFDIFKEAGSLHALTKTFYHLKPTAQGKLNLTFEPIENNATVSGIEVLDESQ
jgi:hypothetical protein